MNPARYVQVELLYSLMYQRILRERGRAVAHHLAYAARNLGRAGEFASACLAVRSARCGDTMRAAP